jgi:vancomycin resistance protein YoaR
MAGQTDSDPPRELTSEPARASRSAVRLALRIGLPALVAVLLAWPWIELSMASGRLVGGVRVAGVDVGRTSSEVALKLLTDRAAELSRRSVPVMVSGKRFELQAERLSVRFDVPGTVARGLRVGRDGSLVARTFGYYVRLFRPHAVAFAGSIDAERVAQAAREIERTSVLDPPYAGGIELRGTDVIVKPSRGGHRLATRDLPARLLESLASGALSPVAVEVVPAEAPLPASAAEQVASKARSLLRAPVVLASTDPVARFEVAPNELSACLSSELRGGSLELAFDQDKLSRLIEPLRRVTEAEPVDARFEIDARDQITITPSRAGVRIRLAGLGTALLSAAQTPERRGELPIDRQPQPALTTADAEGLGIKGLVSTFTTRHPCCEKRVDNIHRIADILNGKVVRPGETVSVNELVGPRTQKHGFVPAPAIEEGEMVDSVGGGISQFATTLFNALFHGGYDIIERQPHTYWFPRYPEGHEATLSWPKPDIIFRNDTPFGLLIKTVYTGTNITVKLYGDNDGRKVHAKVSGRQNITEPALEIVPNTDMPPDEERVKQAGGVGWSVIVSRVLTFRDGKTKEEKRRVTYKPKARRIEVHPCRIPRGEKGYTGERCPEPEDVEEAPEEVAGG